MKVNLINPLLGTAICALQQRSTELWPSWPRLSILKQDNCKFQTITRHCFDIPEVCMSSQHHSHSIFLLLPLCYSQGLESTESVNLIDNSSFENRNQRPSADWIQGFTASRLWNSPVRIMHLIDMSKVQKCSFLPPLYAFSCMRELFWAHKLYNVSSSSIIAHYNVKTLKLPQICL